MGVADRASYWAVLAVQESVDAILRDAGHLLRRQQALGALRLDVPKQCLTRAQPAEVAHAGLSQESAPVPAQPVTLDALQEKLQGCTRCGLHAHRTSIVFGAGNPNAELMFVGEGPGRDEDLQGQPFVGEAGKLLNRMILAMGLVREQVYITNIVKCRPLRNRDPLPEEVKTCAPFLQAQIQAIKPQFIVALGRFAAQALLEETTPIGRLRGNWRKYQQIAVMPTFHPAYLLRNPKDKRLVWQDLQAVMKQMGLPVVRQKS